MKILKFKGKMTLKNKLLISAGIVVIIAIIGVIITYIVNEEARDWINVNILKKEVSEEDVATIKIDADKTQYIYAYDKYIVILSGGKLEIYNNYASKINELDISISNPIFEKSGNYLVIAETNGQKVYLISDGKIQWENKLEGNISKVNVSKTGNVSVITKGTSFKSVVSIFDRSGKELFKTYLASTIAVDSDISLNGKYLAIAEVNISGAVAESGIKIIEVDKASTGDTTNSVVYKYNADANKIIRDIKYQERGQLVCIYNDSVHVIENDEEKTLIEFSKSTKFSDIELKSHIVRAEEVSTGLFSSKTNVILTNVATKSEADYEVGSVIKNLSSYEQITAVNLGAEVHFVNLNGWLEKKYISVHEIKDVVLGTTIAGIVYRDRIKIITF